MWGRGWCRHQVTYHSDNAAVVSVIQRRSAKDPLLLHLLWCLYFYAVYYQFSYCACHVPGVDNVASDALSCNNMSLFSSLIPQGTQTLLSQGVLDFFILHPPNWGSQDWITLFRASLLSPLPLVHYSHTVQHLVPTYLFAMPMAVHHLSLWWRPLLPNLWLTWQIQASCMVHLGYI